MTEVTWPIKAHTVAKHDILRGYLGAWFSIMSKQNRRILYLEGFAGPGIYEGGEPGSPLIALDTLIDHPIFLKREETEFIFVFIEKDNSRFRSLNNEIQKYWLKKETKQPKNITVEVIKDDFKKTVEDILEQVDSPNTTLVPTFAFVDPFGWAGVSLDLMTRLISFDRCEVLVTFMYDSISRFLKDPYVEKSLVEFFGTDKYKEFIELAGEERKSSLQKLFVNQLREKAGFKYMISFELISERGKTEYFLIHGTRHQMGFTKMKEAMWTLDASGGFRFSARSRDKQSLFDKEPSESLKKDILQEFKGKEVNILAVESYVDKTLYLGKHMRESLRNLEIEGAITVTNRNKKGTYPKGTLVKFEG